MYLITYTFTLKRDKTCKDLEPCLSSYKNLLEGLGAIRDSMKIFHPFNSRIVICQFAMFECVFDNNCLLSIAGFEEIAETLRHTITDFNLKITAPKGQQVA